MLGGEYENFRNFSRNKNGNNDTMCRVARNKETRVRYEGVYPSLLEHQAMYWMSLVQTLVMGSLFTRDDFRAI